MTNNPINVLPPHYLHELPMEDEERLEKLFTKLDSDGNGTIDIHDLSVALKHFGVHHRYAEKFIQQSDKTKSGSVSLADFIHYVREHEKNLKLHFSDLDKNRDGKIDLDELIRAFSDLGIPLSRNEATNLLQRMDQDGSLNISYDEWRDYLLYAPTTDIHGLINYWRHSTYLDVGEDIGVPDDFTNNEMQTGMWWRHLAAGGVAGAVSRTGTAPLDRLKVFLQVSTKNQRIFDCMRNMLTEGGLRGMWRGNFINVLKIAPESAIKFAAYEKIKRLMKREGESLEIYERFCAGAMAGGISQSAIYPMEVLKTRLALRKTGEYRGILDAAKRIYYKEGLVSFYRGYIPNILGIIPYAGIDLAVYETLKKKYLQTHSDKDAPSFWLLLGCGSVSSTLGQICSYPLALVRTRLQAAQVVNPEVDVKNLTMMKTFRAIIHREGAVGLYRGITPNFIKVIPAVSISYVVYEYSSRLLGVKMT